MQDWLNILKSNNIIHQKGEKSHMIAFNKCKKKKKQLAKSTPILSKILIKLGSKEKFPI